jgi:hypothetical protein
MGFLKFFGAKFMDARKEKKKLKCGFLGFRNNFGRKDNPSIFGDNLGKWS